MLIKDSVCDLSSFSFFLFFFFTKRHSHDSLKTLFMRVLIVWLMIVIFCTLFASLLGSAESRGHHHVILFSKFRNNPLTTRSKWPTDQHAFSTDHSPTWPTKQRLNQPTTEHPADLATYWPANQPMTYLPTQPTQAPIHVRPLRIRTESCLICRALTFRSNKWTPLFGDHSAAFIRSLSATWCAVLWKQDRKVTQLSQETALKSSPSSQRDLELILTRALEAFHVAVGQLIKVMP